MMPYQGKRTRNRRTLPCRAACRSSVHACANLLSHGPLAALGHPLLLLDTSSFNLKPPKKISRLPQQAFHLQIKRNKSAMRRTRSLPSGSSRVLSGWRVREESRRKLLCPPWGCRLESLSVRRTSQSEKAMEGGGGSQEYAAPIFRASILLLTPPAKGSSSLSNLSVKTPFMIVLVIAQIIGQKILRSVLSSARPLGALPYSFTCRFRKYLNPLTQQAGSSIVQLSQSKRLGLVITYGDR